MSELNPNYLLSIVTQLKGGSLSVETLEKAIAGWSNGDYPSLEDAVQTLQLMKVMYSPPQNDDNVDELDKTKPFDSETATRRANDPSFDDLDRFKILRIHDEGGLGIVYQAEDKQLNRVVILKKSKSDSSVSQVDQSRFYFEAEVTGQLEHPGIVPIYAMGRDRSQDPYYAMRFIRGKNFLSHIKAFHEKLGNRAPNGIELRKMLRRFVDVCNAIHYAHTRGVFHRDLKPANIMLGEHGETIVVDWGLAKLVSSQSLSTDKPKEQKEIRLSGSQNNTAVGTQIGTPAYAPPEQIAGELDKIGAQSDVYGLGAILYELLTGHRPISRDQWRDKAELLAFIRAGKIPSPISLKPNLPRPLNVICQKAMAVSIDARYSTACELAEDIELWMADERIRAYRDPGKHEPRLEYAGRVLRKYRSWTLSAAASLVLIALIAGVASYFVNLARINESIAKRSAQQFKSDAVDRYRIAKGSIDTLVEGNESLQDFPATKDLQQRLLQRAADDYRRLSRNVSADPDLEIERLRALVRVADIQHLQNRTQISLDSYHDALEIAESSTVLAPFDQRLEIARIHARMGLAFENANEVDQAENEYRRAIGQFKDLSSEYPFEKSLSGNHAVALANRAAMFQRQGDPKKALELAMKSQPLFDIANDVEESKFVLPAILLSQTLGSASRALGLYEQSNDHFQIGIDRFAQLEESLKSSAKYQEAVAGLLVARGNLERERGANQNAERDLTFAVKRYAQLIEEYPDNLKYMEDLGLCQLDLGLLAFDQGLNESAKEELILAREYFYELNNKYPHIDRFRVLLSDADSGLGQVLAESTDEWPDAETLFNEAINFTPNDPERRAIYESQFGHALRAHGRLFESEEKLAGACDTLRQLMATHATLSIRRAFAAAQWRLGLVQFEQKNESSATEYFREAISTWGHLASETKNAVDHYNYAKALLRCPIIEMRDPVAALVSTKQASESVKENVQFASLHAEAGNH